MNLRKKTKIELNLIQSLKFLMSVKSHSFFKVWHKRSITLVVIILEDRRESRGRRDWSGVGPWTEDGWIFTRDLG